MEWQQERSLYQALQLREQLETMHVQASREEGLTDPETP